MSPESACAWGVGRLQRLLSMLLPDLTFITLHYLYIVGLALLTAILLYASSTPAQSVRFIDALFLTTSAVTEAGLNTVNLSQLNTWQQALLFLLIVLGSSSLVSWGVIFIRFRAFESEFKAVAQRRRRRSGAEARARSPRSDRAVPLERDLEGAYALRDRKREDATTQKVSRTLDASGFSGPSTAIQCVSSTETSEESARSRKPPREPSRRSVFSFTGIGATASSSLRPRSVGPPPNRSRAEQPTGSARPSSRWIPSSAGFFLRNSQVHGLSRDERIELGGREYSAVRVLAVMVFLYIVLFQLLSAIGIGAWIACYRPRTALDNGVNPWWAGVFMAISAYNNCGMSLIDANMTAFQDCTYVILTMILLILAGNTCYPLFLRLAIWTTWKIVPQTEYWHDERETLRFLLDHPRRVYTHLFPSTPTWWLAVTVLVLNCVDWFAFEAINVGNEKIQAVTGEYEWLDGLFQAIAVRSGGFYIVPIPDLRIGVQVLYVFMMFIGVYPVTIPMRHTNVYEERALGIFRADLDEGYVRSRIDAGDTKQQHSRIGGLRGYFSRAANAPDREHTSTFVRHQMRAQLAHDAWFVALIVLVIMIIQYQEFEADPVHFSVFNVIFEVVSPPRFPCSRAPLTHGHRSAATAPSESRSACPTTPTRSADPGARHRSSR